MEKFSFFWLTLVRNLHYFKKIYDFMSRKFKFDIIYYMRLSECKKNKHYSIVKIDVSLSEKLRRRLYDLGFLAGQKIRVVNKSLLKKAYMIEIRGYTLSLRNTIVNAVMVE